VSVIVDEGQILSGERAIDLVVWDSDVNGFGNVKFPWDIGRVVEDYLEPSILGEYLRS